MEAEPVTSRWHERARAVLPLLVLLAVAVKSTADEWRMCDLTANDETQYLALAWQMSDPGAQPAEQNPLYVPLYVAWYRLLLLLPVEGEYLPFLNHALLLTLLTVLLYALVRRLGAGRWVGVIAASVLMLHTRFALVSPFPVHLATIFVAFGALVGTYQRSAVGACGPVGFALLAACYARNEFGTVLLAFLPAYVAAGLWSCRRPGGWREFLPWIVPLALAVGVCAATVGLPMPDGPRGLYAFGQHYARNAAESTGRGVDVWNVHWQEELFADFGEVGSVGEAARARPRRFAWHVGRNVARLPNTALELCRPKLELSNTFRTPAYLLVLAVLGVGLVRTFRRACAGGLRGPDGQPLRAVLVASACAAVVSGSSVVLIYPRDHYLVLPMFFLLVLAAAGLPAPRWPVWLGEPNPAKVRAGACAASALLLLATPTARHDWTVLRPLVKKQPYAASFELRETSALLRSLPRRGSAVVLLHHPPVPFVTVWMAQPVYFVPHELKVEGFRAFTERYNIGIVVLDRQLREDGRFAGDREFLELWDEIDTGAFAVLKSPGGYRVAVRRDLLAHERPGRRESG